MLEAEQLASFLSPLSSMIKQASRAVLACYHSNETLAVRHKSDQSPVTAADLASHRILTQALQQLTPSFPIVSEESAKQLALATIQATPYWLIDPLDGTKEFMHQRDEFTINLALMYADQVMLGMVHVPVYAETYFAYQGGGCCLITKEGSRPLRSRSWQADSCVLTISRAEQSEQYQQFCRQCIAPEERRVGSAYKFCLVARGEVDFYPRYRPSMAWDTAAGQCLLEQAGGCVLTMGGQSLSYPNPYQKNDHFIVFADPGVVGEFIS